MGPNASTGNTKSNQDTNSKAKETTIEHKTNDHNNNNNNGISLRENREVVQKVDSLYNTNRPEQLSENAAKFQHYLKFLYKNNFVSLTYDDLYAFMIQYHWRRYFIEKIRMKKRGIIDVIYSSLEINPNVASHISNTFVMFESKKYPFRCYDLMTYKSLAKVIEPFGGGENLPAIFINGYYIGSFDQIQELEDMKLINRIINSDYLTECLICHISKTKESLDTCPFCFKKYMFFCFLNTDKYDIKNSI